MTTNRTKVEMAKIEWQSIRRCVGPLPWIIAVCIACCACTRTYDGSIIPTYSAQINTARLVPVIAMKPNETRPRNGLVKFPPAPELPPQSLEKKAPIKKRRKPGHLTGSVDRLPRAVQCLKDTKTDVRIRLLCS